MPCCESAVAKVKEVGNPFSIAFMRALFPTFGEEV